LFAACRFAARIAEVEEQNREQPFGGFWEEILQNSLAVAVLTVAGLESYANELYFEGAALAGQMNPVAIEEVAALIDRKKVLDKFSAALAFRAGKKLDRGVGPVQNADALIDLRNAVVHFRPEWTGKSGEHRKLSARLKGKFDPTPVLPNELLFPRAWASASFARWAIRTAVAFLDYFYQEAGMENTLTKSKPQLSALSGVSL
jgi:hypothetical protein